MLTNTPKPQDILFTIMENKKAEKKTFTLELEQVNFCHFCLNNYLNYFCQWTNQHLFMPLCLKVFMCYVSTAFNMLTANTWLA